MRARFWHASLFLFLALVPLVGVAAENCPKSFAGLATGSYTPFKNNAEAVAYLKANGVNVYVDSTGRASIYWDGNHPLNKLADRLRERFYGTQLVIDFDALNRRSAAGMFDPRRNIIYLDHRTVRAMKPSRTFVHEFRHLVKYKRINYDKNLDSLLSADIYGLENSVPFPNLPEASYRSGFTLYEISEHLHDAIMYVKGQVLKGETARRFALYEKKLAPTRLQELELKIAGSRAQLRQLELDLERARTELAATEKKQGKPPGLFTRLQGEEKVRIHTEQLEAKRERLAGDVARMESAREPLAAQVAEADEMESALLGARDRMVSEVPIAGGGQVDALESLRNVITFTMESRPWMQQSLDWLKVGSKSKGKLERGNTAVFEQRNDKVTSVRVSLPDSFGKASVYFTHRSPSGKPLGVYQMDVGGFTDRPDTMTVAYARRILEAAEVKVAAQLDATNKIELVALSVLSDAVKVKAQDGKGWVRIAENLTLLERMVNKFMYRPAPDQAKKSATEKTAKPRSRRAE